MPTLELSDIIVIMEIDDDLRSGLNIALNEASFLNVRVDRERAEVGLLFSVLTLPQQGPEPGDPRVVMRLGKVGRISASLRHGEWDDETADVEPFSLEQLSEVVLSFHGLPIYGWEFIDPAEGSWQRWRDRLSLDETLGAHGTAHHIDLFQAGGTTRHLDLRVWFDDLIVYDMAHDPLNRGLRGGRTPVVVCSVRRG